MKNNKNSEANASKQKTYKVLIDNEKHEFEKGQVSGEEILIISGNTPTQCFTLYQKLKNCDFIKISVDELVDLSNPGIEKFAVKPPEVFHYFLDEEPETTDRKELTASQILELGGLKPANDYYLIEVDSAGVEISHKDTPDLPIEMKCPGSKFVSIFRGETPVSNTSGHGCS